MRTYSGHSTARASNELYRTNLARGQTGLSIAFDLPTQIGYDPDAPEAAGEVGKVGVPVAHLGHMRQLFDGIPVAEMNTSMTINAHRGLAARALRGQRRGAGGRPGGAPGDDPERHREGVPEPGHLHLPARAEPPAHRRHDRLHGSPTCRAGTRSTCAATTSRRPGRHRSRRSAYALANAIDVLDGVRRLGQGRRRRARPGGRAHELLRQLRGPLRRGDRQDAGVRARCGTASARSATASADERLRRFRYGVQVNSLGLTEAQPENNIPRIVLETLGVTPVQERPGPGHPAAGVERGPRPPPARGTSSGRCGSSRSWPSSPTCSSTTTSSTAPT